MIVIHNNFIKPLLFMYQKSVIVICLQGGVIGEFAMVFVQYEFGYSILAMAEGYYTNGEHSPWIHQKP